VPLCSLDLLDSLADVKNRLVALEWDYLENPDSLTTGFRSRLTTTLFIIFGVTYATNQSFRLINSARNDMILISELG
jgi:hypothetical protein